jgi:hypothetical protein
MNLRFRYLGGKYQATAMRKIMAEGAVMSELFSGNFPANREK